METTKKEGPTIINSHIILCSILLLLLVKKKLVKSPKIMLPKTRVKILQVYSFK